MTHEEARRTNATAAYLIEELTPSERDEFEEHMFSCSECANRVKSGSVFLTTLRTLLLDTRKSFVPLQGEHDPAGYVLGDLAGAAREHFEQHLPGCVICTQRVTIGKQLLDNLQRALCESTFSGGRVHVALQFSSWLRTVVLS